MSSKSGYHEPQEVDMRHLSRIGAGLAWLAALVVLATGTALAGNFGEVTFIEGAGGPPTAGEEREIRFSLLQHGVVPIEDGRVDVTLTHAGTGEDLTVQATHAGDGIWVAAVTFPLDGDWRVAVGHEWFETSTPTTMAIAPADRMAWLPAALAVAALAGAAALVAGGMRFLGRRTAPARQPVRAEG
jgi:hypothetical protein